MFCGASLPSLFLLTFVEPVYWDRIFTVCSGDRQLADREKMFAVCDKKCVTSYSRFYNHTLEKNITGVHLEKKTMALIYFKVMSAQVTFS